MSLDENKAIVRKFVEVVFSRRNWDRLDDLVAPDYVDPDYPQLQGREGLKQMMNMAFKALPDWYETIEDIIAEGDKVWILITYTGTHTGEFMGLAPTGNKIKTMAVDIYRIVNGKLAEYWTVVDTVRLFKPQGVIEITEEGKKFFPEDAK